MSSVVGAESAIYGSKESNVQEVARLSSESQEILRSNDSLQDLQNELQQFLSHHISRLNSMRKGLSSANVECSANLSRNDVLSAEALCDYPPNVQSGSGIRDFQRSPSLEEFDAHNALLARFLETHIANLRNLQKKLSENGNQETMVQDIRSHVIGEKQYRALSDQFNMLVIISTFTAALIIAFLSWQMISLVQNTVLRLALACCFLFLRWLFIWEPSLSLEGVPHSHLNIRLARSPSMI
ncbi:hypothetical protein BDQ17DRAFT_410498 [Cyathus striatus]|nr:hypothetical protein BDQ17DRAFT_410498 [Cyathus striatus]